MNDTSTSDHREYFHDGIKLPSCTEIVGMLNKPELVSWANYMGFKRINTKRYVQEKAQYGTYCHSIFDLYFSDGIMVADTENRNFLYKFKIIELYFEKMGIRVLNTEFPIEGTTYGGTMDMIAYNTEKDCLIIFDLKTSKKVRMTHWIQLMGYVELIEEQYNLPVDEVGVILISEDMYSPKLINIRYTKDCWRERDIFHSLKTVWYRMDELKKGDDQVESPRDLDDYKF